MLHSLHMSSVVYYFPVSRVIESELSRSVQSLLDRLVKDTRLPLEKVIPIKTHFGEPGNISYIPATYLDGIINFLKSKDVSSYFIETNTAGGPRSQTDSHLKIALEHGFTQLPCVIADSPDGLDDLEIPITGGKYFSSCRIARKLVEAPQIILASHFKGHMMSGFGGTLKNLGIGFASGRGKAIQHTKNPPSNHNDLDWEDRENLYVGSEFRFRTAEYALAAADHKPLIYLNYALKLVENCDCDGEPMQPLYPDLGVFASLDPVAIDKAVFDLLTKRESKKPFTGNEIFPYAEALGLGNQEYQLIKV